VIAEHLSIDEVELIRKTFMTIDTDNNGKITFEELKVGLQKSNSQLSETEMILLMEAVCIHILSF
jgi:calcium-dependent protein kinase